MLALVGGLPSLLSAQGNGNAPAPAPGNFIQVRLLQPSPSEQANLEAALAALGKGRGAAGEAFWHVYQSVRGPGGYMIVQPDRQFNNLPPIQNPDGVAGRIQSSLSQPSTVLTVQMSQELSTGAGGATAAPPGEFMRVRWMTTSASNRAAAFAWQRDQLLPALTKAGGNRRGGRVVAGGNVNQFVEFAYTQQLGRTGWNLAESMGQRNFDEMVGRLSPMITNEQIHWYRFRPDLSFSSAQ